MVKRAIIHIGMHKTGSSSIQASLRHYDDGSTFYANLSVDNHSIPIYTAFSSDYKNYHILTKNGLSEQKKRQLREYYRAELVKNLSRSDRDTVVVSGEDIGMLDPGSKVEFVELVKRQVPDIHIICYVRDPVSFAASSFQQRVKSGLKSIPNDLSAQYRARLETFTKLVGMENVIVKRFATETLVGESVVQDFCELAGLDYSQLQEVRANVGLTLPALKLVLLFNRTNPCHFGDNVVTEARNRLIRQLTELYSHAESIESSPFSALADFSDERYLEETFGITFERGTYSEQRQPADIMEWLCDVSDINVEPLDTAIENEGLGGSFKTIEEKLNRLYYHYVHLESKKLNHRRLLKRQDADVLRDVALKFEDKKAPTKEEAIKLLSLALRARPYATFISQKIQKLKKQPT